MVVTTVVSLKKIIHTMYSILYTLSSIEFVLDNTLVEVTEGLGLRYTTTGGFSCGNPNWEKN